MSFFSFSFEKVTLWICIAIWCNTFRSPFNNSGTLYMYYICFCLHVQRYFQYITVKRDISSLSYELHYMFRGQCWTFVNSLAEAQHTMCLFCIFLLSLCLSLSIYIHRFTHTDAYWWIYTCFYRQNVWEWFNICTFHLKLYNYISICIQLLCIYRVFGLPFKKTYKTLY